MIFLDQSQRLGNIREYTTGDRLSHFKNLVLREFWANASIEIVKGSEEYYTMNRAIGSAVDSLVSLMHVSYRVSADMVKHREDKINDYAKSSLGSQLASQIIDSEVIPGLLSVDPYTGDRIYNVEVAVIGLPGLERMPEAIK